MPVRIAFPAQFADLIGGRESVAMEGETVREALIELTEAHPELASLIWGRSNDPGRTDSEAPVAGSGSVPPGRELNPVVVVFLNGEDVRTLGGLDAPLEDGDELLVISAVEGG